MAEQKIYKSNCNGNSFTIILKDELNIKINQSSIQHLCTYNRKEMDDGLLIVDRFADNHDFSMDYYNNDGSWETFCANGALCVINLLLEINNKFKTMTFRAGDGVHQIKFKNSNIYLGMNQPLFHTDFIEIGSIFGRHVDSGARHFVALSDITDHKQLYKLAREIRFHDIFKPHGINVNFLGIHDKNTISVITYEKGIEKIMKSCGSGSVAAAFYAHHMDSIKSPTTIINQGGKMYLEYENNWEISWLRSHPKLESNIKMDF